LSGAMRICLRYRVYLAPRQRMIRQRLPGTNRFKYLEERGE